MIAATGGSASAAGDAPPSFERAFGAGAASVCTTACQPGGLGAGAGEFSAPADVAASGDGGVLVVDQDGRRVEAFSSDGSFVRSFGTPGDGAGQLAGPTAVAQGGGEVFVADPPNHRISVFSVAGVFLRAFGAGVDPSGDGTPDVCTTSCQAGTGGSAAGQLTQPAGLAVAGGEAFVSDPGQQRINVFTTSGTYERTIGTAGDGAGGLDSPAGLAIDGGDLYVADRAAERVSVFTLNGTFERAFGAGVGSGGAGVCTTVCIKGTQGAGAGQLDGPAAVAVATGSVYVSDAQNNRLAVFDTSGTFERATAGVPGGAAGQLDAPTGVAVSGGVLSVAERGNRRISSFTTDGAFLRTVGKQVDTAPFTCTTVCRPGSPGTAPGQLSAPTGVATSGGEIFTADRANRRISVSSTSGGFLRAFGLGVGSGNGCTTTCALGTGGGAAGALAAPAQLAAADGLLYVADPPNARVSVFSTDGTFVRAFGKDVDPSGDGSPDVCTSSCKTGSTGSAPGQLDAPTGVTVADGEVYVTESDASQVSVFDTDGTYKRSFGAGQLDHPAALAVAGGEVFVADRLQQRVSVFTAAGTFERAFGRDVNASNDGDANVCTTSCVAGTAGDGAGALSDPDGIAVALGQVFISDRANARVSQFTTDGAFVQSLGKGVGTGPLCTTSCHAGTDDGTSGSLSDPAGLATVGSDLVVADQGNHRVSMFGVPRSLVAADPEALDLGFIDQDDGPGPIVTTTVRDTGNTTVTLSGLALGGADAAQFSRVSGDSSDCAVGAALAPGASCALRVRFDPSSKGAKTGMVTVSSNAADLRVVLSATGTQADLDGDGISDRYDPDVDGDGIANEKDAFPRDPTEWLDSDGDGIGDNADRDDDNDGVPDDQDAYPLDPTRFERPGSRTPPTTATPTGAKPATTVVTVPSATITPGRLVRKGKPRLAVHGKKGRLRTGYLANCAGTGPKCVVSMQLSAVLGHKRHRHIVRLVPRAHVDVTANKLGALTLTLRHAALARLPRHRRFAAILVAAIRRGDTDPVVRTFTLRLKGSR